MGTAEGADVIPSGVYRIDLGGGWFYLGSSKDLTKREGKHRWELGRGDHGNKILQNVFNKYQKFDFIVLGRYPVGEILGHEQVLLDKHFKDPKCANVAAFAGRSMAGRKASDATRSKMSASRMGHVVSVDTRAKISAAQIGRKISPEHRRALIAAQTGLKHTPERCAKKSAVQTGKKLSLEHCAAISQGQKGKKVSDATRAAMSAAHMGKKLSPEHCAALSVAQTLRWARVREAAAAAL